MPESTLTRLLLALSLLVFIAPACVLDDPGVEEGDVWACATDADCLGENVCIFSGGTGVCQPPPTFDCYDQDGDGFFTGSLCEPDEILDCDDGNGDVYPGATELCNGVSDDCDEEIDENVDMVPCGLTQGVCNGTFAVCMDGEEIGCEDNCPGPDCGYGPDYVTSWVGADCDTMDADCDGDTMEGCPNCTDGAPCGVGCGAVDAADCACKIGEQNCTTNQCIDPATNMQVIFPFALPEDPGNGVDDDCNGVIDG